MLATVHPRRVGLQPHLDRAQVQGPPPPPALTRVVARAASPAAATPAAGSLPRPDMGHQSLLILVELDLLDDRLLDPQQGTP